MGNAAPIRPMAIETEIKLRVDSHEPIRRRLQSLSAVFVRRVVETNCVLDRLDGFLRHHGCGLRIRSVVDPEGRPLPTELTFKGPRRVGDLKSREELEIDVEDAEITMQILQRLGFHTVLCYQKRRESWRLGDCLVELDEPAALGLFVEIEGPNPNAIRGVQRELQLADAKAINISYVGMLIAYCEAQRITDRTIRLT